MAEGLGQSSPVLANFTFCGVPYPCRDLAYSAMARWRSSIASRSARALSRVSFLRAPPCLRV